MLFKDSNLISGSLYAHKKSILFYYHIFLPEFLCSPASLGLELNKITHLDLTKKQNY
ncbi:hypothetical protein [Rickettsia endosymbiont of Cantharis rufa]|uniref:hypothetical protein n=1 Tax=Rickettsia endosymbiont of Cantharis rufa TaxID=3066248 RepID=UPI003132DBC0